MKSIASSGFKGKGSSDTKSANVLTDNDSSNFFSSLVKSSETLPDIEILPLSKDASN